MHWFERIKVLHNQGATLDQLSQDEIAKTFINKLNYDNNPLHHSNYYKSAIKWALDSDIKYEHLSQMDAAQFLGTFENEQKEKVEILMLEGLLVARQKSGFISWLKPMGDNNFLSNSFFKEVFKFSTEKDSNKLSFRVEFPYEAPYQQQLNGQWTKM